MFFLSLIKPLRLKNKSDRDDGRVISKERGETLAGENGIRFFETSAQWF
jgi:hypothetical protein